MCVSLLQVISLSLNQLTGPIPELSMMSSLRSLRLDNNHLSQTLPDSLSLLTQVWAWVKRRQARFLCCSSIFLLCTLFGDREL